MDKRTARSWHAYTFCKDYIRDYGTATMEKITAMMQKTATMKRTA